MEQLSKLQEYILKKSLGYKQKGEIDKNTFFKFYENIKNKPKDIENIIIKSLTCAFQSSMFASFQP